MNETVSPPDARLLLTSHCPHCPTVLAGLTQLVKEGLIGRLEAVNIEVRPDVAEALGVRAVPWLELGPFRLQGLRSPQELRQWAERAHSAEGMADYFRELFGEGRLDEIIETVRKSPLGMDALLHLLADPDAELQVRLGIGAVMEDLEGDPALQAVTEKLGQLTRHPDARIRNDAAYYLGLSGSERALPYLRELLDDPDADVRDTAQESLERVRSEE